MGSHIHHKEMLQYAQDAAETDEPWKRWEFNHNNGVGWIENTTNPMWIENHHYRRKPRTIRIGDRDVPEPIREPLEDDALYYYPAFNDSERTAARGIWENKDYQIARLESGMAFRTQEDAQQMYDAIVALTGVKS